MEKRKGNCDFLNFEEQCVFFLAGQWPNVIGQWPMFGNRIQNRAWIVRVPEKF